MSRSYEEKKGGTKGLTSNGKIKINYGKGKKEDKIKEQESDDPVCQCEHKKSVHILDEKDSRYAEDDRGNDNLGRCIAKDCQCKGFFPMDPEDIEFLKELKGRE